LSVGRSAPGDDDYRPIGGPQAMRTAAELSAKGARDWIAQKDLASLAQSGPELQLLGQLLGAQGSNADWKKGTANLDDLARKMATAARARNLPGATEALKGYEDQLAALAKLDASEAKSVPNHKTTGGVKTWMLALDFAYNEAKFAKTPEKIAVLSRVLAEEANAMQDLKTDGKWRTISREVRDHALAAVTAAEGGKIDEAKGSLQKAYQRCEFCHTGKNK